VLDEQGEAVEEQLQAELEEGVEVEVEVEAGLRGEAWTASGTVPTPRSWSAPHPAIASIRRW
jgi:hypothetical protein